MIIVIPAKNEEHRIGPTLQAYLDWFNDLKIVVVITPGTDNTESVIKNYQLKYPSKIDYFSLEKFTGNSKGKAIRAGLRYALENYPSKNLIGFIDADNSLEPSEFKKLVDNIDLADASIASRYLPESVLTDRDSQLRVVASLLFRYLVKILFNLPVVDTQCGGKLFKRSVVEEILPLLKIDDMAIDVEILYQLSRANKTIREVPVVWREKQASTISTSQVQFVKTSWRMFRSLIKLKVRSKK
jgi:glycosyltransferase involved in cell wall biosynthesis